MKSDAELLKEYVEVRAEPAFAELVRRHIDLVYSAALRQVGGDAHLARDVAQTVFRDLARKAAALTPAANPAVVIDMARDAMELVAGADESSRLEVAVAVGAVYTGTASPHESMAVDETVVALARSRGDRALELRGLSRLVAAHLEIGDFARADAVHFERCEQDLAHALARVEGGSWVLEYGLHPPAHLLQIATLECPDVASLEQRLPGGSTKESQRDPQQRRFP